jgi:hypothetical protein
MSEAVENPVDVDLFHDLQQNDTEAQTVTKGKPINSSTAFLKKCIHPPSAVPEYSGLPTNDARSQVTVEYRNMGINKTPFTFATTVTQVTPAMLSSFDYAFLMPSGCRVLAVPFIYVDLPTRGPGWTQDYNNVIVNELYNYKNWSSDVNLYRPCYKSTTFSLNATMFNNTGMVVGNQFNPAILFAGSILAFLQEQPIQAREFVRQCHLDTRSVRPTEEQLNAWHSIPKYIREDLHAHCGLLGNEILTMNPNTTVQVVNLSVSPTLDGTLVPTNSQLLGNSLRSYGGAARDGAFSVQRLNTISPAWMANNTTGHEGAAADSPGLYDCYTFVIATDGSYHYAPLSDNNPVLQSGATLKKLRDTLWSSDMTWSWVRFSGLSLNSQTNVSTQLLIIKNYLGIEIQPATSSAFAGLQRLAPKPDLKAMQALMDAFYDLKDVLPAKYNFWGALAGLASEGLKTFGTGLIQGLAKGSSDPVASASAPVAAAQKVDRDVKRGDNKLEARLARLERLLERLELSNGRGPAPNPRRGGNGDSLGRGPPPRVHGPPARLAIMPPPPAPKARPKRAPRKKAPKT